ncbi:MAG: hemerythrin domain-containing protein [Anaerolineae bacterium]
MRPTEQLMEEHRAIQTMLNILSSACRKWEAGEAVAPDDLEQMLEFIQVFADRCHHGKEEDLLFKAMEEAGVPREGGPIGVMLLEHDQGRQFVRGMREALALYRSGDPRARSAFVHNARSYVTLLSQHISKEDNILYPIADLHLTEAQQQELLEGFARVEEERIGPGRHEAFHRLLERLERVYA